MEQTTTIGQPPEFTSQPKIIRTLAVDDNSTNLTLIKHLLSRIGCNVSVASNGQEAIELLSKEKFDIIFMDCHMPIMNGYEATTLIRKNCRINCNTPIIAVTADVIDGNRQRCLDSGMDDYITKPILPGTLESSLEKWAMQHIPSLSVG